MISVFCPSGRTAFGLAALLLVGGAAAPDARAAAPREVRRDFVLAPGGTLKIDSNRGAVVIEESDGTVARVWVTIEADAKAERTAARMIDGVKLDFREAGGSIAVAAHNPQESGLRLTLGEEARVDVGFFVSVPRACNVDVKLVNGSITVGNLKGAMKARLENGPVNFKRIDGTVDASVDFGSIIVSRCTGSVTARVLSGLIRVGTIGGSARLKNTTGDIEVLTVHGALRAEAAAGNVTVGFAGKIAQDSVVEVAGGSIFASFVPTSACRIEATSVWGDVKAMLPLKIEAGGVGQRKLTGTLNGGGPTVKLHANGGYVNLERGEEVFEITPLAPAETTETPRSLRRK